MGGATDVFERDCQVGPEVRVRLEYRLFDAEDALVEAPGPDESIEFIFGLGQAPPHVERAVDGLRVGESRRVQLHPRDAFGLRDEAAIISVDRSELPEGAALGDEFEAESEDGEPVFLRVVDLDDEIARLDANHPLAGQAVSLELTVVSARIATSAELREAQATAELREAQVKAELREAQVKAELREAQAGITDGGAPDVLISHLLRRDRTTPTSG
jgi:FKBP-type peptidyl-prolyl cis-trans isomerase 2